MLIYEVTPEEYVLVCDEFGIEVEILAHWTVLNTMRKWDCSKYANDLNLKN